MPSEEFHKTYSSHDYESNTYHGIVPWQHKSVDYHDHGRCNLLVQSIHPENMQLSENCRSNLQALLDYSVQKDVLAHTCHKLAYEDYS